MFKKIISNLVFLFTLLSAPAHAVNPLLSATLELLPWVQNGKLIGTLVYLKGAAEPFQYIKGLSPSGTLLRAGMTSPGGASPIAGGGFLVPAAGCAAILGTIAGFSAISYFESCANAGMNELMIRSFADYTIEAFNELWAEQLAEQARMGDRIKELEEFCLQEEALGRNMDLMRQTIANDWLRYQRFPQEQMAYCWREAQKRASERAAAEAEVLRFGNQCENAQSLGCADWEVYFKSVVSFGYWK